MAGMRRFAVVSRRGRSMSALVVPATVKPASTVPVPPPPPPPPAPGFTECASVGIAWDYAFDALQQSSLYQKWAQANAGELSKFNAAFPSGNVSVWPLQGPVLVTAFGRALVGFANMRARACHA